MPGAFRRKVGQKVRTVLDGLLSRSAEVSALRTQLDDLAASLARIEAGQSELVGRLEKTEWQLVARLDDVVPAVARTELRQSDASARLDDLVVAAARIEAEQAHHLAAIRLAVEDEAATRRLLREARSGPAYELAWTDPDPLVSVLIPTHTRWGSLVDVAIASVFNQTYTNVEVVVVGDAAGPQTAQALADLNDPRVRYENLLVRGPYPQDPEELWHVAGTGPLNRAMELAQGRWFVILNDDDALRPDHISTLLQRARETHAEVAYGTMLWHEPDGSSREIKSFPPRLAAFAWQCALQHQATTLFEYELAAAVFGEPGDWNRARRMLRAGVSFAQVDRIVADYWPAKSWPQN